MFVTPALWYRITRVVLGLGSLNGYCVPNANVWLFVYFVYCFGDSGWGQEGIQLVKTVLQKC